MIKDLAIVWGIIILAFIGTILLLNKADEKRNRLIKECIADGHKEYYCRGLLSSGRTVTAPVPIIIPAR